MKFELLLGLGLVFLISLLAFLLNSLPLIFLELPIIFILFISLKKNVKPLALPILNEKSEIQGSVIDLLPLAVIICEKNSKITYLNEEARKFIQANNFDFEGKHLLALLHWPVLDAMLERSVQGQIITETISLYGSHPRYYQIQSNPVTFKGKELIAFQIIDISRITHLDHLRKNFVENVSHELKTPLASLIGYSEILRDYIEDKNEPFLSTHLSTIHRNAMRMNNIVSDLLKLAEMEERGEEIEFEVCDLISILEGAISTRLESALVKKIKIEKPLYKQIIITANKNLILQVYENLIDNAIRYSQSDTIIKIEVEISENEVISKIIDQGTGISQKDLEHLFERFYRVDKARSRESGGTGLGLSIVKHIIDAHKGRIGVESQLGIGSIFWFALPKK